MSASAAPPWLGSAYVAALIVHGALIVALVAAALVAAGGLGAGADAARVGPGLTAAFFLSGLVPAIPSVFALLSWWLCRRRGWRPSVGHMGLTAAAALGLPLLLLTAMYLS